MKGEILKRDVDCVARDIEEREYVGLKVPGFLVKEKL